MKKNIFLLIPIALIGFFTGILSPGEKIDFLAAKLSNRSSSMLQGASQNGSWKTFIGIAEDDQPAIMRSLIARIGLGANTKEEALYMNAHLDINQDKLISTRNYTITIPAEMPVNEFWSLTVYGKNHYLCKNKAGKYAVSSFQDLLKNPDGTITIYLGQSETKPKSNWLPSSIKEEPVSLTLRCYNPTTKMLKNIHSIPLPIIEPVEL